MAKDLDFDWFDLAKYDDMSKLTLSGWHAELNRRIGFKVLGRLFNVRYFSGDGESESDNFHPVINNSSHSNNEVDARFKDTYYEGLKKEPIYKNQTSELLHMLDNGECINEEAIAHATWCDVSLELEDIEFLEVLIAAKKNTIFQSVLDKVTGEYVSPDEHEMIDALYDYNMLEDKPLKHDEEFKESNSSLISINFNASNEVLMKQFRRFISIEREKRGNVMISEAKRADWVAMKILPCIDLLIYSEIEGKRISHNKLGQLLFPASSLGINDDFDVVDRVRRTVFGLIKKVLHPNTISMIEYQVEHDENNQK